METQDFPDDTNIRRFCLTLTGEARLWYKFLRAAQLDGDALQECFQQQCSKFCSTREQYFQVWRSFHYDENTDAIDSYVGGVKQVAVLLNYGEPQILELFKNTLPGRLYYMLYQIDDLRTAIETAKWVLTREKIDKQRTGQSSASPFMKASQENSKKNCEKGVSFGALETTERNSDIKDKLTSLVNKLDMKLDRRETQYRPRIYQGRNRGHSQRQDSYRSRDRSCSRVHGQYNIDRGRRNYNNDRNYRPYYRARSRSRNGYGRNDRYDNRPSYRRQNFRQDQGNKRYRNRSVSQDCNRSRQRFRSNSRNGNQYNGRDQSRSRDRRQRSRTNSRERDRKLGPEQNQGLDPVPMLAPIETELGVIDAVNMIISWENAPIH